jgi:hypothetical protein
MRGVFIATVALALAALTTAQTPDPAVLAAINHTRAIDDHAHPRALAVNGRSDDDYDALPCAPLEPTDSTITGRLDNPELIAAWKDLYAYPFNDTAPGHVRWLTAAKSARKNQLGNHYPAWVLDRLGIETEFANRQALAPGIAPPRFRWVPFDDALLLPLDTSALAAQSPDRKIFYAREQALLARYLGPRKTPATLAGYLAQIVTPTLESQRRAGAVAIKFESAYLRALDFKPPDVAAASTLYARFHASGVLSPAQYYQLEDAIFHQIALDAGRLGLPVQFHTGVGCGRYFMLTGANPLLLEGVFNDPSLRGTNFVMLHGGAGPYSKVVAALLMKPNVYTDFSEQTYLMPTYQVAQVIRYWLEYFPERVMFGTDLSPGTPENDWEESGWIAAHNGRRALAIALTGMLQDGEITRPRALELARMVLRGNALRLYQ